MHEKEFVLFFFLSAKRKDRGRFGRKQVNEPPKVRLPRAPKVPIPGVSREDLGFNPGSRRLRVMETPPKDLYKDIIFSVVAAVFGALIKIVISRRCREPRL